MMRPLYDRVMRLAARPDAIYWLAAISFIESSVFPIPPDVLLIPMVLANRTRAFWIATVCTVSSVIGGFLGYAIGYFAFEAIGRPVLELYGAMDKYMSVKATFDHWGAWFIIVKGMTPIPYKLVTIVSGLLTYNFALFVLLSIITRGARFFLLAALLHRFGDQARAILDRHFGAFMVVILVFIVLGFWLAGRIV